MRSSRDLISLRTYALAFAVVLSPALLQVTCYRGDTALSLLELEVVGQNQIVGFNPNLRSYDVATTSPSAVLRATPRDPSATVTYQWMYGSTTVGAGIVGTGGGEVTVDVPVGQPTLRVSVRHPQGGTGFYSIDVTGRFDGLPCTEQGIQDAIMAGGGPYTFACSGPTTVVMQAGIEIDKDVILDGQGSLVLDTGRLDVLEGVTAELNGFTVDGTTINQGTLTVANSTAQELLNFGAVTVTNSAVPGGIPCCTVEGSSAHVTDSAVGSIGAETVAIMDSAVGGISGETLTLTGSSIGGLFAASSDGDPIDAVVTDSTVEGALSLLGPGTLSVTNSTLSGNLYVYDPECVGGGPRIVQKAELGSAATVSNSTIQGSIDFCGASLTLASTLLDGDCNGAGYVSGGYNIESPGNTCGFDQATDLFDIPDLNIAPLADNGGPGPTVALLPGSVAIDAIPEADCTLQSDQRGVTRPQNGACDVGAFEYADCTGSLCDDGNECTNNHCDPLNAAWCEHSPVLDGTVCDFGGIAGVCLAGTCIEDHCAASSACDDGNECTSDSCDPLNDPWCEHTPVPGGTTCDFGGIAGVCSAGECVEDTWGTLEVVPYSNPSPTGNLSTGNLEVAADPTGDVTAVWALAVFYTNSTSIYRNYVFTSRYSPAAGWQSQILGSDDADVSGSRSAAVAVNATGHAAVVWQVEHNGIGPTHAPHIWSQQYMPGIGWVERTVFNTSASAGAPDVAVDPTGAVTVMWNQQGIWSNRYTPGVGWGAPELVAGSGGGAELVADPTGAVTAVWSQQGIWSNRYTPGVGWGAAERIEDNAGTARTPELAVDPTGHVTVVWSQDGIWSNRYVPAVGWGVAEQINAGTGGSGPQVAVDPAGNATVVWSDGAIWSRRYTPGVGWGAAEQISAGGDDPQVAVDSNGGVTVVWRQSFAGGPVNAWSNRYTPGVGWGTAQVIGSGNVVDVDVTVEASGSALAVWKTDSGTVLSKRSE